MCASQDIDKGTSNTSAQTRKKYDIRVGKEVEILDFGGEMVIALVPETRGRGFVRFMRKLDKIFAEYKRGEEKGDEKMNYVLGVFVVLTYIGDEEGADKVEEILDKAKNGEIKLTMNYVNLGEVYYIIARELGLS